MCMLSLILNIFLASFHRLCITRTSVPLSSALCMPPFSIHNPYKSGFFFIIFWAWISMQASQQGGIGEVSTNSYYIVAFKMQYYTFHQLLYVFLQSSGS